MLLVEDDGRAVRPRSRVLARGGYSVEVAPTVGRALQRIDAAPALDGIMLGLLLPDGPGERVLDALEAAAAACPPPVLVVTRVADAARLVALMRRGYHVWRKPLNAAAVCEAARWLVSLLDPVVAFATSHGLSPRETEVLRLGVNGLCGKEIATRLGCAVNTVWVHWQRIAAKCGCDSQRAVLGEVYRYATQSARPSELRSSDRKDPL